jgi:hypothetical protein
MHSPTGHWDLDQTANSTAVTLKLNRQMPIGDMRQSAESGRNLRFLHVFPPSAHGVPTFTATK